MGTFKGPFSIFFQRREKLPLSRKSFTPNLKVGPLRANVVISALFRVNNELKNDSNNYMDNEWGGGCMPPGYAGLGAPNVAVAPAR